MEIQVNDTAYTHTQIRSNMKSAKIRITDHVSPEGLKPFRILEVSGRDSSTGNRISFRIVLHSADGDSLFFGTVECEHEEYHSDNGGHFESVTNIFVSE